MISAITFSCFFIGTLQRHHFLRRATLYSVFDVSRLNNLIHHGTYREKNKKNIFAFTSEDFALAAQRKNPKEDPLEYLTQVHSLPGIAVYNLKHFSHDIDSSYLFRNPEKKLDALIAAVVAEHPLF